MSGRRFTLLDAMVLVAATAVGIAGARLYLAAAAELVSARVSSVIYFRIDAVSPCLSAWSVALIALRLGPPRPPLRRLVLQPGIAACLVAAVALPFTAADDRLGHFAQSEPWYSHRFIYDLCIGLPRTAATGVAMTWLVIGLGGRWRRSSDWLDLAGRMLGVAWLAIYLAWYLPW